MKLSIAIADKKALASAFVVYRGFEEYIPKVARLGFHGVELALKRADEVNQCQLSRLLKESGLEVSCISTGQVFADGGLMLTHESTKQRNEVMQIFKDLIDLSAEFGQLVNIGRVRGLIGDRSASRVEKIFVETVQLLCDYAATRRVTLLVEPVNRYETDFINTIPEGSGILRKVDRGNTGLMADVFHMNIEDKTVGSELATFMADIGYIHLADSNRQAPGQGHLDFADIFNNLFAAGYNGWVCAEILPLPDPDTAAERTASFLLPLIEKYNRHWGTDGVRAKNPGVAPFINRKKII